MARKKSATLTDAELRIMDVLWDKGEATVKDVTEALSESQGVAYNTVLTVLRILNNKGYVEYRKEGRAFVYSPLVNRKQERRAVLQHLLDRFFNNSPALLVQNLIEDESLDAEDLARLKKRIADSEREDA